MGVLRDKLDTRRRLMVSGVAVCQPERSLMVMWRGPSTKATLSKNALKPRLHGSSGSCYVLKTSVFCTDLVGGGRSTLDKERL